MKRTSSFLLFLLLLTATATFGQNQKLSEIIITKADLAKVGTAVPVSALGEPAGSVKLYEPRWVDATENAPAYGVVEGSIFSVDPKGWPINFRVLLPASWSQRAIHQGGGGMNGSITVREGRNPGAISMATATLSRFCWPALAAHFSRRRTQSRVARLRGLL